MLSTKNTNCDSFPEPEVTHQKWEWCQKLIPKSTQRPSTRLQRLFTVSLLQSQASLVCMIWSRWGHHKLCLFFFGSAVLGMRMAEGLVFIRSECRANYYHWPQHPLALCWTVQDGKSASANPHSRPFPNSKPLLHWKQLVSVCQHRKWLLLPTTPLKLIKLLA